MCIKADLNLFENGVSLLQFVKSVERMCCLASGDTSCFMLGDDEITIFMDDQSPARDDPDNH